MACYIYVGPVGSGKTFNAFAHALELPSKYVFHNLADLAETPAAKISRTRWKWLLRQGHVARIARKQWETEYGAAQGLLGVVGVRRLGVKVLKYWDDFNDVFAGAAHGVILGDEIHLWLDARKWDEMSPEARRKISEHRKDHLTLIFTAQHVSFVDRIYRILCDEVRLIHETVVPFLGWLVPDARRKGMDCAHCLEHLSVAERDFYGRPERMTVGDKRPWTIRWLLGCATIYWWRTWPAVILGKMDTADDEEIAKTAKPIGWGVRLFSQRLADQYSTLKKLSGSAAAARAGRGHAGRPEIVVVKPKLL